MPSTGKIDWFLGYLMTVPTAEVIQ